MRACCRVAAARLSSHYGYPALVVPDYTKRYSDSETYKYAANWSDAQKPAGHLAVHSNAGGGHGTDTFYSPSSVASKQLAAAVQKTVAKISPGRDGGIHAQSGWRELAMSCPSALIEVEFHDNAEGAKWIATHHTEIGNALADGVAAWLGLRAKKPDPHPGGTAFRRAFLRLPKRTRVWVLKYIARWAKTGG
jgi:hypothetical protein